MVEIVYLAKGEKPPVGKKRLLIEAVRGLRGEQAIQDDNGVTLRVNPRFLDDTIADCRAKAEEAAMDTIYVRGGSLDASQRAKSVVDSLTRDD
ncbi:hypothetical protein [Brevundimonas sp.]|uniref:hypothetical protein n=1 Tax=Brevundimonas sp. TaxID=1871086 RepID=UPI002D396FBB|nr:hypothetical protein [Brevundimonas sp.]HYD28149.1 hypothetical protein [Brevundimonas sp.]